MAVLIPHQFARMREIELGSVIDLGSVRVVKRRRRFKFSELMKDFKSEHRHGEWNLGDPAGKEIR